MANRKSQTTERSDLDTETEAASGEGNTPAPASEVSAAVHRGVEKWIDTHLRNTAFSRDTKAWNVLHAALPSLAPAILEEIE